MHMRIQKKKPKGENEMTDAPEGTTYLNFETFMEVDLRVGKISAVEDHPNADRLFVVTLEDGTEETGQQNTTTDMY